MKHYNLVYESPFDGPPEGLEADIGDLGWYTAPLRWDGYYSEPDYTAKLLVKYCSGQSEKFRVQEYLPGWGIFR